MDEINMDWTLPADDTWTVTRPISKELALLAAMQKEARNLDLPLVRRLAYTILVGEEDAVWPLIDEIMATRTPPDVEGLPTYHELLEVLRKRNEVILDLMTLGDKPRIRDELNNDFVVQELVKRCEGVGKVERERQVEAYLKPRKMGETT